MEMQTTPDSFHCCSKVSQNFCKRFYLFYRNIAENFVSFISMFLLELWCPSFSVDTVRKKQFSFQSWECQEFCIKSRKFFIVPQRLCKVGDLIFYVLQGLIKILSCL